VVDGFCLVSSDSDYTRLATRIREAGVFVMGIGKKNTPKPFVNACDLFVYTENLTVVEKKSVQPKRETAKKPVVIEKEIEKDEEKDELDPMPMLTQAFEVAVQDDGWASLATMGNILYQLDPGFDPRTYGHKQLSRMILNLKDKFEVKTKESGGATAFYVKIKE
jgi:Fe-S-cluster formation regulator IscX/YfhJ